MAGAPRRATVRPKQSLGQNFLIDDNIARNIVRDMHLKHTDVLVEIGPGHGALTTLLAGKTDHLIAVEIDNRIIPELKKKIFSDDITLVHQDFLEAPIETWAKNYASKLRIVGNIPYHVTAPILFKIFDCCSSILDATIMMQREVAKRLVAQPGTKSYGILSVMSQFYGIPKLLFDVSPNCFFPKPKVTSTVVQLRLHDVLPHDVDEELFRTVVKTTFGKRRKTLRNSLQYLPFEQEVVDRVMHSLEFPMESRPEDLSVHEFVDLAQRISHLLH